MTAAFSAWVERWQVGPGMNDVSRALWRQEPLPDRYSGHDGMVGDGWVPLLDRLAADLVTLGWDRGLVQVKEKFGLLRFMPRHWPQDPAQREAWQHRLLAAEDESARTCERCGAPGERRLDRPWVKTLCGACHVCRMLGGEEVDR